MDVDLTIRYSDERLCEIVASRPDTAAPLCGIVSRRADFGRPQGWDRSPLRSSYSRRSISPRAKRSLRISNGVWRLASRCQIAGVSVLPPRINRITKTITPAIITIGQSIGRNIGHGIVPSHALFHHCMQSHHDHMAPLSREMVVKGISVTAELANAKICRSRYIPLELRKRL